MLSPAARILRTILFLPVEEAERRERRLAETERQLKQGREQNAAVRGLVSQSAEQLRDTYDKLLERNQ